MLQLKTILIIFLGASASLLSGQQVNKKITLLISQAPVLRVEAGNDVEPEPGESTVIGTTSYITGGTPGYFYHWEHESGDEFDLLTPEVDQTGKYILTVSDQENCTASDSLEVLGLNANVPVHKGINGFTVAYNGATKNALVTIPGMANDSRLQLISSNGKVFYEEKIFSNQTCCQFQLDLSGYPDGLYLVSVSNSNEQSTYKIIKQ